MNFQFIDAHCQPQFPEFEKDLSEVLSRMKDSGVAGIVVGTDYEMSRKGIELAEKHSFLYATAGVHPNEKGEVFDYEKFRELAQSSKVVAIGECGLDYYRNDASDTTEIERQKIQFKRQIELAIELDKPLMIHSRNAYEDIIAILSEYKKDNENLRGDIHFYSGSLEQARKFIDLGFTISFAGPITFARDYDEVIKNVPLTSILAETDAPFAAPVPYRGRRNEPTYVIEVVKKIAEVRGEDFEIVRKTLVENTFRVFGIVL